jgi:hypothetical protein
MSNNSTSAFGDKIKLQIADKWRSILEAGLVSAKPLSVGATVIVYEDRICHVESRQSRALSTLDPDGVALAVKGLFAELEQPPTLLLLLPSTQFLLTEVQLPGVARESLRSAIRLQSAVLVPSYTGELAFSVSATSPVGDNHNILWMSAELLDEYFAALQSQGFFLAAIMPRILAMLPEQGTGTLLDEDNNGVTHVTIVDDNISQWQQVSMADLEEPQYETQWNETLSQAAPETKLTDRHSLEDYLDSSDTRTLNQYTFVPSGASTKAKQSAKGRRLIQAVAATVVVALMAASPFFYQGYKKVQLAQELEKTMLLSSDARADQALVRDFESRWGVLNEFPVQDISTMLLALQQELSPSVLSSLEVDEGKVQIEGESADPQSLLERLEQNQAFTGLDFSRATNNNRYSIEMRLSTVDFDGYKQWYFPDERR